MPEPEGCVPNWGRWPADSRIEITPTGVSRGPTTKMDGNCFGAASALGGCGTTRRKRLVQRKATEQIVRPARGSRRGARGLCLPAATTMVERRLRGLVKFPPENGPRGRSVSLRRVAAGRPRLWGGSAPRTESSTGGNSGEHGAPAARTAPRKTGLAARNSPAPGDHHGTGRPGDR